MIVTYDWEFLDDGKTIEPISLGMVAENGDELYAVNVQADWIRIAQVLWMRENVLRHLDGNFRTLPGARGRKAWIPNFSAPEMVYREQLAEMASAFLVEHGGADEVQLWADYPATDHVALYQLFGPMIECTKHGMPMRTSCLTQQEQAWRGWLRTGLHGVEDADERIDKAFANRPKQSPETEHHALHDARHDMQVARWLGLCQETREWFA